VKENRRSVSIFGTMTSMTRCSIPGVGDSFPAWIFREQRRFQVHPEPRPGFLRNASARQTCESEAFSPIFFFDVVGTDLSNMANLRLHIGDFGGIARDQRNENGISASL